MTMSTAYHLFLHHSDPRVTKKNITQTILQIPIFKFSQLLQPPEALIVELFVPSSPGDPRI